MTSGDHDGAAPTKATVPICAIGASAGGVRALQHFFGKLPDDLDLAYIVILHLSPEHPSAMAEILATCTDMPVRQVTDTPELAPNCVYVIPPDRELVIEGDSVTAREFSAPRGSRAPVDMFFRSVAEARGDGMAVILSGSGSDGASGVRAMHEAGAVVFAQDPGDAEFAAMPQNAIATGVVNFTGTIDELVERIAEVARSKEAVRSLDADAAANDLRRIVGFLRARTGHDFSSYKRATVMRRILRRMQVARIGNLDAYADYVRTTPEEAHELFDDLLISVTQFFRDEAAFDTIASKLAGPLFEEAGPDGIRAWCVGCATGEEAYSLAMILLEEAGRRQETMPIQVFASDLDEGALATAREGRYPRSIEADVGQERLNRFFVDEGTHYRVRRELREAVLFASHSVLRDPPFMRLDLISCRNLMIYLERSLQEQLLTIFHYGLRPSGYMFLGSAETADSRPDLFGVFDREARLYTARPMDQRRMPTLPHGPSEPVQPQSIRRQSPGHDRHAAPPELHAAALERAAPPSILVDHGQQILHLSPAAGRFIQHSGGAFSARLPMVVRPELRLDLKVALDRALDGKVASMTHPAPVTFDDGVRRIALQVAPVRGGDSDEIRALVLFLDAGPMDDETSGEIAEGTMAPDEVRRLHSELKVAQEALVASRAEHELAIEDLRAANEELQSINEEYRSTSEELETSKEELQSMNEELQTVNSELKGKLKSISTAHSDLRNLTSATEIGTLFLDAKLRIRMFTPPMAGLFNITDMDVGREITDFTNRLRYDGIEDDARRVLRDLSPAESEVQSRDGRWFMMRIRPYRTVEDRIEGVVLTFVDITARRDTERELLESRHRYETLFNSIDEGFCIMEILPGGEDGKADFRFVEVNEAFERQTGLEDAVGKTARELIPGHEEHWFERYARIAETGEPERFEAPAEALGYYYEVYAFPMENGGTPDPSVAALFRDVSDRKETEAHQELLTRELSHRVKNTLAVVQALARPPGSNEMTVAEYRKSFIGRIQALARAHDQLLNTNWQSADLKLLIEETLAAYGGDGQDIEIGGPPVLLTPKQGLGIALILHELATNASKYGALSTPRGRLSVRWHVDGAAELRQVRLAWRELGGPPVPAETTKGFGTRLIERSCTYELEGTAELRFGAEGLELDIAFPKD